MHLFAREEGEGPAVLLIHSSGMSSRQWRKLVGTLAPTHRVIAPDLIGSGQSPPWADDAPFHFHRDVDALEAAVAHVPTRVHVVGHSYGGLLALTLARRSPGRVASLALYDPVAFGVLHDAGDLDGLADLAMVDDGAFHDDATGGDDAWYEQFVDYWNGPGVWRQLPERDRTAFLATGRKVFSEVTSLLKDRTPLRDYVPLAMPTLLLTGSRTPIAAQRVVALLATAMPHARVETIEGAGHMGPITHGAAVNELVAAHIAAS
ncbi:MAG: alpha/beta hydrolase [Polyangia bacterium]